MGSFETTPPVSRVGRKPHRLTLRQVTDDEIDDSVNSNSRLSVMIDGDERLGTVLFLSIFSVHHTIRGNYNVTPPLKNCNGS